MRAMSFILAGQRTTRVQIQRDVSEEVNASHQPVEKWQPFMEAKVHLRQLEARETQYAGGTFAAATHMATLRGNAKSALIKPGMRIVVKPSNRVLNIFAVNDVDNRHREIQLWCGEEVAS